MTTTCNRCGAVQRINYPHGRKSKGVVTFLTPHDRDCPRNKDRYKKRR